MSAQTRPKVAAIVTAYYPDSHADVIVGKLIAGYDLHGVSTAPRLEVASLFLDQTPLDDTGRTFAAEHGIPVFETIGEAIGLGRPGVNVDGVLLIGEHGDYPLNERGQILYPRRAFFDAAVAAMVAAGRTVPTFVDKHLSWSFADARRMHDTAARLGVPLLAGSSVPVARREPALEWPIGEAMAEAVVVGYGPPEAYEFHALEGLQAMAERRAGGETGVAAVEDVPPAALPAARAVRRWTEELEVAALLAAGLEGHALRRARATLAHAFLVEYADGLRAAVLRFEEGVADWAFAGRAAAGPARACRFALEPRRPYGHFTFLVRQIEALVLAGRAPYPPARTLLTTGVLDAAMRSRHLGGVRLETPELAIAYAAPGPVADTGLGAPLPDA
ncbi:MAG: hypothetical protein AVDCRST_MAG19-3296 [uncultured Thermomicrobiales bacterium]|uniref:Uncharacterized protein n=1 Tax=uncultured Thermomicrobiales bacterium TaxID=1645740 RepID=A0A6J4VF55_9BACT|nr:MAG: hypothetical protein AVDCRST_MAG19-3296 [uncultured Thermomicrobiales bacterium]